MSFQALNAVRTVRGISSSARLVLFVLAQFAGADGTCHPSQKTIAEETGLSERTVRTALDELKAAGIIEAARRVRRNGSRTSDELRLLYYAAQEAREDGARLSCEDNRRDLPVGDITPAATPEKHLKTQREECAAKGQAEGNRQISPVASNRQRLPLANRQNPGGLPAMVAAPTTFESVRESPEQETDVSRSGRVRARAAVAGTGPEDDGGEPEGFAAAFAAYPLSGRGRTDVPKAASAWALAVDQAGGVERLTAAVRAFAADPTFKRGDHGAPSFQRWLVEKRWLAFLPEPGRPVASPSAARSWPGPVEVREAVVGARGEPFVASYLDPAEWDEARRAVIAANGFSAERMKRDLAGVLSRLGVQVLPPP